MGRRFGVIVLVALWAVASYAQDKVPDAAPAMAAPEKPAPTALKDKIGYSIGVSIGKDFKELNLDVDLESMVQGIHDAMSGHKLALSDEEIRATIKMLTDMNEKRHARMKEPVAAATESGPKLNVVDAASLGAEFARDVRRAEEKYKNKTLTVRGIVISVVGSVALGDADDYLAYKEGRFNDIKTLVGCVFSDSEQMAKAKPGEVFTATGMCVGRTGEKSGVFITDCTVTTVPSIAPAPATQEKMPQPHDDLTVFDVSELVARCVRDPEETNLALIKKRVAVKGQVLKIAASCVWLGDSGTFATIQRDDLGQTFTIQKKPFVACDFDGYPTGIKIGDIVTVQGRFLGMVPGTEGSIMVLNCSVLKAMQDKR